MTYSKFLHLLFILIPLLVNMEANAQHLQAKLSHYSTDNGLASNAIAYLSQDDYGYIWIATWNGLSRFDGYNFYNYQTGAGSHIPHLHNRIMDFVIDNQQNIWMRMYDGRVFYLNRQKDMIMNPFEGINGEEEFRTKYPLTVTSVGDVLVNIDGVGLYKLRADKTKLSSQLITTGGLDVTSMAEGYQNDIWLGTDKGVHRMDISNLTIERKGYFLNEKVSTLYSNGYNIYVGTVSGKIFSFSYGQDSKEIRKGGLPINALFVDSHGVIWFSDSRQGAIRMFADSNNEKLFSQTVLVPDYDGRGGIFNETNGTVWVRMNHGGFGYYNRETDEVEYFHNDPTNSWNLSNTVNASLELNEGVVWESTSRRGLEKLEILKKTIGRKQLFPEQGASMANEIRTMLYDQQRQTLLIGNKAGQLFFIHNDGSKTVINKDSKGRPLGRTYGISKDSKGNYWLCSKDNGVFKLIPAQGGFRIVNYCHEDHNEWSMNSNSAYAAIEDKEGNIWVATYGGGVNLITTNASGQEVVLNSKNSMKEYPYNSHRKVRTIALDRDGNVWAGTTDGILIMSYKDKKMKIRKLETSSIDPDHILMSNDIVCLATDRQGTMWVGTNGGGLARTIGKDLNGEWLFEHFGSHDGLPSEEIRSITFDDRGNVWFSTDHVLCSFDISKRIFTTFSTLDGVDETMCSEGAAINLPNGNVLFGTLNGYYEVDRAKLITSAGNILKLRITDFWINDELQSPRLTNYYDFYIPDSRSFELPNSHNVIAFRFASLNYQLQHRVHYQYILEGYDHEWKNADKSRVASYAQLPTGVYHFKVKAFLLESPEKYDLKQIEVIVPPPFLLSSSAVWLYMLVVAVIFILFMFKRQEYISKREHMRVLREGPRQQNEYENESERNFMEVLNEFMEIHYSDPMLSVEETVTAMDMSQDSFTRLLRHISGLSPKDFISEFRLRKAIKMLENTDDTIAQIAYNCGYGDPVTFNRHFKAKTGMMPSKYRDLHKQKTQEEIVEEKTDDYERIE